MRDIIEVTSDKLERVITVVRNDGYDLTEEHARTVAERRFSGWQFGDAQRVNYDTLELRYRFSYL